MKKTILISTVIAAAVCIVVLWWSKNPKDHKKNIAIVTTLSHPALLSVRQGFIEALSDRVRNELRIIDYNAEGSLQQANLIAAKISKDQKLVGVLAIGTLAAQTLAKAEKTRPVIVGAVSDPKVIVPNSEASNVCGVTDAIDANFQIDTILKLLPKTTSISLLYSPHEANSAFVIKELTRSAEDRGLRVALVGIHEPQQIMMGSQDACRKSDVVLIPLDNQLAASMQSVLKATRSKPCPVITSDQAFIQLGASLSFGVDYRKIGRQAGSLMQALLDKKITPKDIGFLDPQTVDVVVNDLVVKEKRIELNLQANIDLIHFDGAVQ